jgi:glutaredoxin-related protein
MRPALARSVAPLFAALLLASLGCGSARSSSSPRTDRSVITKEQILQHRFANAYEAVEALHSNWLITKVTDSFNSPSQIRVYVDATFFGGVETLRSINPNNIQSIRHFDGVAATARWGLDHGQGVILVSTQQSQR